MKKNNSTPTFTIIVLFAFIALFILAIDAVFGLRTPSTATNTADMITIAGRATVDPSLNVTASVLTAHEIAHMRYMREEEKLAHDVYQLFAAKWNVPVFANIVQAEYRHTDVVLGLLLFYGIPDPSANLGPGQFSDPRLFSLYNTLIEKGSDSLTDALVD